MLFMVLPEGTINNHTGTNELTAIAAKRPVATEVLNARDAGKDDTNLRFV